MKSGQIKASYRDVKQAEHAGLGRSYWYLTDNCLGSVSVISKEESIDGKPKMVALMFFLK